MFTIITLVHLFFLRLEEHNYLNVCEGAYVMEKKTNKLKLYVLVYVYTYIDYGINTYR